jgi:hypothetical protein
MVDAESGPRQEFEPSIDALYAGPLESFVTRRDALAKELRAAGRREDSATVKSLRKPARMAWALDAAALDDRRTTERLAAAVAATLVAQSGGGDLRGAMHELRDAVQNLADNAARAATDGGQSVDDGALANAIMAVIGAPGAFDLLRAGRLVDIPEAGGLGLLTSLPRGDAGPSQTSVEHASETSAAEIAAGEALRRAELAVAAARERSAAAERALRVAEANAESADRQLRLAQQEALARQAERDRARQEAEAAAAQLLEAEMAAADAGGQSHED